MSRTVTRLAAGAVAGGLVLALSACSSLLTNEVDSSSDGARAMWEGTTSVRAANLVVLAAEEGGEARLVGALTNRTNESVEMTFGFVGGSPETVTIDRASTYLLDGSDERDVVLEDVPVGPGANVEMTFSTPSLGQIVVSVPVLDDTLPYYGDLVP